MNENINQIINHIQNVLDKDDENYSEVIELKSDDKYVSWTTGVKLSQPNEQHSALRNFNYSIKDIIFALINEFGIGDVWPSHGFDGSYTIRFLIGDNFNITVYLDSRNIDNVNERKWLINLSSKMLFDRSLYSEYDEEIELLFTKLFPSETQKGK